MRPSFVAVLVALFSVVGLSLAQPESFRSLSTSGLIYDDLDLWVHNLLHTNPVPDRLVEVPGYRIYSGIANLASGEDRMFDESEDGESAFMLGGSAEITPSTLTMAGLADFFDDRILEDITLYGPSMEELVTAEGEAEATYSVFTDVNGDGVYDSKQTVYQHAIGWADSSSTGFSLWGGFRPGPSWQMGAAVGYNKTCVEDMPSGLNYSEEVSDTNLVTGAPTFHSLESYSGSEKMNSGVISGALSGRGTISESMVLGGMFSIGIINGTFESTNNDLGSWDYAPGDPTVHDDLNWTSQVSHSVDASGTAFGGGAELAWDMTDIWRFELGATYNTASWDGSTSDYVFQADSLFLTTVGSLLESDDISVSGAGDMTLEHSDDRIAAGVKTTAVPVDFTTISFGVLFGMESLTQTEISDASYQRTEVFDDGDSEYADPDDYVATSTWSQTMQTRTTEERMTISIPVGVEVEVLPRVALRLGARPGFVDETETTTTSLLAASPVTEVVEYGDGSVTETVEDPWTTYDGTLSSTSAMRTEIPYSYGIGFDPVDYVQIDLMGFDGDLSDWRLSATVKF
ncbi:hypothetical protein JW921_09710 [Candidatus Fermentibacterales bacterium]|nr:hypothetical protein [Candidatus Fermentibacterales bacterium]